MHPIISVSVRMDFHADRRPPVIYKRDDPPGPGHATKAPATQLPPPPPAHRSHRQVRFNYLIID